MLGLLQCFLNTHLNWPHIGMKGEANHQVWQWEPCFNNGRRSNTIIANAKISDLFIGHKSLNLDSKPLKVRSLSAQWPWNLQHALRPSTSSIICQNTSQRFRLSMIFKNLWSRWKHNLYCLLWLCIDISLYSLTIDGLSKVTRRHFSPLFQSEILQTTHERRMAEEELVPWRKKGQKGMMEYKRKHNRLTSYICPPHCLH
jgi:hypothetical protein